MVYTEVGMIIIKPMVEDDSKVTPRWAMVDQVMRQEMYRNPDLYEAWSAGGYDRVAKIAPELFGMTAMYRDERDCVTFEFTDEQWTIFALRWLT